MTDELLPEGGESQPAKNEEELPPITAEEANKLNEMLAQMREAMKPFLNR